MVIQKVLKVIDSHIALRYKIKIVVNMTVVTFRIFLWRDQDAIWICEGQYPETGHGTAGAQY